MTEAERRLFAEFLIASASEEALFKEVPRSMGSVSSEITPERRQEMEQVGILVEFATARVMRAIRSILGHLQASGLTSRAVFSFGDGGIEVDMALMSVRRVKLN